MERYILEHPRFEDNYFLSINSTSANVNVNLVVKYVWEFEDSMKDSLSF